MAPVPVPELVVIAVEVIRLGQLFAKRQVVLGRGLFPPLPVSPTLSMVSARAISVVA